MKRHTVALLALTAACGDDGATPSDAGSSGATTSPQTTSGGSTAETSGAVTETDTAATGSSSTGATTAADETMTTDASSSTGRAGSSDDTDSTSTGGTELQACLPPEIFAAIDQHAHDLVASAALLAGHPSEGEVTGFMAAPGLPAPPAVTALFFGPLIMPCSSALLYDPYCEEGRCSQIECTGQGAGWIDHLWLEPALTVGRWQFDEVHIHVLWSGGDAASFEIVTTSSAYGVDVSMVGDGVMDLDELTLTETFPNLHPAGATVLTYGDDPAGYSGDLQIADVVVADVDAAGHLQPTGVCP